MDNKGFTLIELIATIMLLSIVMAITTVSVVNIIDNSKEKSYNLLVNNIKIGAQGYFEECENKNITNNKIISCPTFVTEETVDYTTKYFETTLLDLAKYGFLKSTATDSEDNKIVENPQTNENISNCKIKVTKKLKKSNYKVSYETTKIDSSITVDGKTITCPTY